MWFIALARERLYLPPGGRWPSEARSEEEQRYGKTGTHDRLRGIEESLYFQTS